MLCSPRRIRSSRFCLHEHISGDAADIAFGFARFLLPVFFRRKPGLSMSLNKKEIYEFGDFRLDVDERTIERIDGGQVEPLPAKTFDALVLLVRKQGHLVSKDEFLAHVWPDTIVEENNLEKRVHRLRQFLGVTDSGRKHIETVRGHGYRFVAPVDKLEVSDSWLPETYRKVLEQSEKAGVKAGSPVAAASPATSPEPPSTATSGSTKAEAGRAEQVADHASFHSFATRNMRPARRYLGAFAMLAVLAAGSGLWYFGAFRPAHEKDEIPFDPPPRSIAVLPFADLSPVGDREYLADGISEEILNALTQIPGLTVIARTSSFAFKGSASSIADIARRLNVAYVLEGSVRTEGVTARVTAQLVSAEEEAHLWSRTFDLPLGSAFDLQDRVAKTLLGAVARDLGLEPPPILEARHRPDPEAWEHVLRGRFFYGRRGEGDLERALREFDAAIEADPEFADGWAGRASMLALLGALAAGDYRPDGPAMRAALVGEYRPDDPAIGIALERALALDPDNPEALVRMAVIEWRTGRQEVASQFFDRAIRVGDNSPLVQGALASNALAAFELEPAVALQRRAAALDPLSRVLWANLAYYACVAGDLEEGESAALRAQEIRRDSNVIAIETKIALLRKDDVAARALAGQLPDGPEQAFAWTVLHNRGGDAAESDRALARLRGIEDLGAGQLLVMAHAVRGETDAAFQALAKITDRVLAMPPGGIDWSLLIELRASDFLAPLHGDPRWPAWVADFRQRLVTWMGGDPAETFRRQSELGTAGATR